MSGPVMGQHPTSDAEKLAGIVAQVRADLPEAGERRLADVLRQRLEQAGVEYDDQTIVSALADIREG